MLLVWTNYSWRRLSTGGGDERSLPCSPCPGRLLGATLIHQSAWKVNSANFALTEFSEVRSQHEEDRAFTPGPLRSSEHSSRTRFSTFLFLAAFLHCLQDFVGTVEALGVCVPDPLHQLLWGVV